jgi:ABC-2 type transport system ATP-binding protein
MTAISVQNLTKRYSETLAVDGVSFEVPRGSITALLGGNGAGKTTTISMLLGVLTPTSGAVTILGTDMLKNRFAALPRMNFSSPYVDLPRKLTVRQVLEFYARLYGVHRPKQEVARVAGELDVEKFMDRPFGRLSAGQQTRVALAKAMINTPELLLLDEPTASLDPDIADRMRSYLDTCRKKHGMTILLASHNMREVERLSDNVLMMREGKIVDRGAPQALMDKYGRKDMEEVFLHVAREVEA